MNIHSCGLLSAGMQQGPRSHRHGKQHTLSEGSMFIGVKERVDHNQISRDFDHGCRSESMIPMYKRSSMSERMVETPNYSGYSIFSNPEKVRFLPAYTSHSSQEYGLDIDAEVGIRRKDGVSEAPRLSKVPSEGDCLRLGRRNCVVPTALDLGFSTNEIERHGNAAAVSMHPRSKISIKSQSDRSIGPLPSDVRMPHGIANKVSILKDRDEVSAVNAVTGSRNARQSCKVTRSNTKGGKRVAETESSSNAEIERSISGCSNCFGRVISSAKGLSNEGSISSPGNTSQDLPSRKCNAASRALRKGLSRRSLRSFSCISSSDVFPSVTKSSKNSAPNHVFGRQKLGAHDINHKSVVVRGVQNSRSSVVRSAGCMVRRKLQSGFGVLLSEQGAGNEDLSLAPSVRPSAPTFKANKWCLMRPNSIKSDTVVSKSTTEPANSALQEANVRSFGSSGEMSGISTESVEDTSRETVIDEQVLSQRLVGNSIRGSELYGRQSGHLEVDRRNTAGLLLDSVSSSSTTSFRHDGHSASSSIFSGSPSTSRIPPVPSLFEMSPHTRSLEVISSPSSYMSSPDAQFSNSDMPRSYASSFQSPTFSRAVSSPEYPVGYQIHAAETPVYRPFRQYPLRSFEGNQMCLTFEGLSEILSAREHMERDEISYEQLFMLEANLLFGGITSHDQHRDMRLDVDNMSYEELLALEERIGSVCTGLERDKISSCLKSKKYSFIATAVNSIPHDSEFKCSICQEEFEENVELGILDCGHNHHFLCIEQWLLQKNQCPICKAPASS